MDKLSSDELEKKTVADLRKLLRKKSLPEMGRKAELIERLMDADRAPSSTAASDANVAPAVTGLVPPAPHDALGSVLAELRKMSARQDAFELRLSTNTSTSESLTAPSLPAASISTSASGKQCFAAVSPALRERVVTGQFVELHLLLPQHGVATLTNETTFRLDTTAESGSILLAAATPKGTRKIKDLPSWLEAWTIYAAIYSAAHPPRSQELFSYQHLILNAASKFQFGAVLEYDRTFRAQLAANPSLKWDHIAQDLYTTTFDARASLPFRATEVGQTASTDDCRLFNRGKCFRKQCRYRHACSKCGSSKHGEADCTHRN